MLDTVPARTETMMPKILAAMLCSICITGCYTVNNERFAEHVHTLVAPGIKLDTAVRLLQADGFDCSAAAPPQTATCAKTRQRLLPSTCIERVNLYTSENATEVNRIEVRPILCAGL